jgi:MSHA biogenesis protein MshP
MNKIHKGFSIITAIFLLVVLGTLGTLMVTFFAAQQQSSAIDVQGSKAYQASRAGIEWAAYNIRQQTAGTLWAGCAAVPSPLFSAGALLTDLSSFTVNLTCSSASAVEASTTIVLYDLTSTANSGGVPGNADYVERVVSVKIEN